jgi:Zn-finger nucleic acid-binding protein
MVKGPVSDADGTSIEVDGCLKCGSLWFDNREIEPFVPDFETVTPAQRAHTPIERTASAVAAALGSLVNKLNPSKHLEDGDDSEEPH